MESGVTFLCVALEMPHKHDIFNARGEQLVFRVCACSVLAMENGMASSEVVRALPIKWHWVRLWWHRATR